MASVLFVSTMNAAAWGGSEELWSQAAALLAGWGHDVACAVPAWPGKEPRLEGLRAAGCEVRALPNWRARKRTLLDRLVHEGLAKPVQVLAVGALPWGRFDHVVVSQGGWADVARRPFRRLDALARGYSLVYHSYFEDAAPSRPDDVRRLALNARWNLFAAHRIREVLAARLGVEPPNSVLVHNPLTVAWPSEAPPWNAAPGPLRMVGLGALELGSKAQDVLVGALAGDAWRDRDWRLDLFGDGPDRVRLEHLVRRCGLADRIALRGHTGRVAEALAAAHLVVQASRVDAMPIVVHEAMSMARPCLVTRVGDMARWIQDGESGFVADRPEAPAVALALERAWGARARLEEMGRRARDRFRARYPADPVGEFSNRILEAVSDDRRGTMAAVQRAG